MKFDGQVLENLEQPLLVARRVMMPAPDDSRVLYLGCPDKIGREFEDRVIVEVGGQPLRGQLDPVALDAREANFERVAIRRIRFSDPMKFVVNPLAVPPMPR